MYKRVLVLLDGSKLAEVVFSYARELSGRLGLDLELLYLCTDEQARQLPEIRTHMENVTDRLQAQSEEIRNKVDSEPGKKAIKARGNVVVGYRVKDVLKYVADNNIDIMMLATHGSSGDLSLEVGSMADKVIHETSVPVWLIPGGLHEGILYDKIPGRFILVPLDGSEQAEEAIPHAVSLARQRGAETKIVLINISKPVMPKLSEQEKSTIIGKDIRSLQTAGEVYLKKIVEQLKDAGVEADAEQLVGDPAEEIVRYAAAHEPRLIVMATNGRSGFSRLVFGNVAENVLRRLQKTPLFLIKPSHK